jgi:hypothetical protein
MSYGIFPLVVMGVKGRRSALLASRAPAAVSQPEDEVRDVDRRDHDGHEDDGLKCGRPASCRPAAFRSDVPRIFPLPDDEKAHLLRMYPADWRPRTAIGGGHAAA